MRCFHNFKKIKGKKLDWIYRLHPEKFRKPVYLDKWKCSKCGKEYDSQRMLLCFRCGSEITFFERIFNYEHSIIGDSHRKCPEEK